MSDFFENMISYALLGVMFLGAAFVIVLVVFLFFAGGVWLGAFCGYLLSFTPMGQWVHSALIAVGADMGLRNLGALLGFIGSLLNIKLVNPVIAACSSWFLEWFREHDVKHDGGK
jgi:polyferredoxin